METLISALVALLVGKPMIGWLARLKVRQTIYAYAPETHRPKEGTPTMGGFILLLGVGAGIVAYALQPEKRLLLTPLLALFTGAILFAFIGIVDDHLMYRWMGRRGLEWKTKLLLQLIAALASLALLGSVPALLNTSTVTMLGSALASDAWMLLLGTLWVVGWVNAFNLTDGLDGLASGLSAIAFGTLAVLAQDMVHHASALLWAGASLGYLWWNAHPAKVFMGDTGSMALGATFGLLTWREVMLSLSLPHAFLMGLIGAVFAVEVLTVIIQLSAVKMLGRRVFKATPIHHHFELLGWKEPEIVVRFWLVGALCALSALALGGTP